MTIFIVHYASINSYFDSVNKADIGAAKTKALELNENSERGDRFGHPFEEFKLFDKSELFKQVSFFIYCHTP